MNHGPDPDEEARAWDKRGCTASTESFWIKLAAFSLCTSYFAVLYLVRLMMKRYTTSNISQQQKHPAHCPPWPIPSTFGVVFPDGVGCAC